MNTQSWPAWFYGPNGASEVFETETDVPKGWQDHPSKVISPERTGSTPLAPAGDRIPAPQRGSAPITGAAGTVGAAQTGTASPAKTTGDVSNTLDADGWPWSGEMHSATQSQTKAGLWRMKVGVSRPDPKPGFPKPVLDL